MPSMVTADCASRFPKQDNTTTATPIARASARKMREAISRIDFCSIPVVSFPQDVQTALDNMDSWAGASYGVSAFPSDVQPDSAAVRLHLCALI